MPTCQNIRRFSAEHWAESLDPTANAWISFSEPEIPDSIISNHILRKLPNLKISCWDCVEEAVDVLGDVYLPPTKEQAAEIVNFILQNRGKNFIINCAAGISRSGAVCAFLEKNLGYDWTIGANRARPNKLLLQMMNDCFVENSSSDS